MARRTRTTTKRRTARHTSAIGTFTPRQLAAYFRAKLAAELGPHNVKRLLDRSEPVVLLDVRSADGYRQGHIPGARSIPFEELPQRLGELPRDREIITYCWNTTCLLCTKAAYVLASKGYRAKEMIGGIAEWRADGFPVEQGVPRLMVVALRGSDTTRSGYRSSRKRHQAPERWSAPAGVVA